ncbi:SusC/RagA family TonB-linked outer membrane protein [Arachidicoccus sp.]|uniref:SusC/RagA family TonB-linked outer membrane protein n=1 Tax=Arachidicoccus sp. TaxID=1872624 RepID=UPI003D19B322
MYKPYYKIYLIWIFLACLMVSNKANAQSVNAANNTEKIFEKATVVDDFGKPLSHVRVTDANGHLVALTDSVGGFPITVKTQQILYLNRINFDQKVIKIDDKISLQFRMHRSYMQNLFKYNEPDSSFPQYYHALYGDVAKTSFLGSITTVSGNEMQNTPAPQYTYALTGRLTGLNVLQTSGFYNPPLSAQTDVDIFVGNIPKNSSGAGPTDNTQFNIQLRGHGASYGQSPMVIIDGIQREIYSLDPDEIASVSVLKDALSTILLGQNSSRGALVVTTLQPKKGKARLSFSAETGFQSSLKLPTPLSADRYAYLLNEALTNDGKNAAYTAADFDAYKNGTDPYGHPNVNWYDNILAANPMINRYNLNVTGGTDKAQYLVALGYLNQDGMFKTSDANSYNTNVNLKRYSIDSKINFNVNKDFTLGLNIIGRLENNNQPGAGTSNILNALLNTPNNAYPIYNPNGSYGGTTNYTNNLMAQVESSGYLAEQERDILVNLDLNYNLDRWIKGWWFKANGNVSVQSASYLNRSKQVPVFQLGVSNHGDSTYTRFGNTVNQNNNYTSTSWARYWYTRLSTGYNRDFGDNSIGAYLLYDQKQTLLNYDLPSVLTNYALKANYNFKEKYFLEGGADYGGYSRYASGHQYGLFYAGGIGWDVAKENFIKDNISWLNQFKLRATYGKTGNANVDYYGYYIWRAHFQSFVPSYGIGSSYPAPIGQSEGSTLANINATWEKAKKMDFGLDLALFNNHLKGTYDYYHERYYDVMQSRGSSIALVGANYPAENIGVDLYTGHEFTLTYQNSLNDFSYFITANASIQHSKVLFMDEQYEKYPWNVHTGLPVGQRFGLQASGFIQNAIQADTVATISGYTPKVGDVLYKDLNHDGVIDQFDVSPLGGERPLIYYGLSLGISYKGLEINMLLQGVQNNELYVANSAIDAGFQGQNNGYGQAYQQIENRWTPENASNPMYPRLTAGGNGYNYGSMIYTSSSLFLHDDNYFRIKNVGIAYNLPYKWLKHLKVGGIKVFVNALNLFTNAQYNIVDPEVSLSNYPLQKVINTGINIKL